MEKSEYKMSRVDRNCVESYEREKRYCTELYIVNKQQRYLTEAYMVKTSKEKYQ